MKSLQRIYVACTLAMLRLDSFATIAAAAMLRSEPSTGMAAAPLLLRTVSSSQKSNQDRSLQTSNTFVYRVNYTAHYQVIQDTFCDGPPPTIRVNCRGPNIQLLNTSHPSIVCDAAPRRDSDDNGWTFIQCNTTCASDAACRNVYLTDQSVETGRMASIDYSCAGNDLDEIDGAVEFVDTGDGLCGAASGLQTRNIHVLRMGVSCPNNATGNGQRDYVFDDYYMECSPPTASFPYGDNIYTCVSGNSCNGLACNVDFDQLTVEADVPSFADRCVESLVPIVPTAPPATAPTTDEDTGLVTYATTFVASWGLLFDAVSGPVCTGYTPTVQITCLNGNAIALADTPAAADMNCTTVDTNIMVCTDTNSLDFVNRFSSIDYVSGNLFRCKTYGFQTNSVEYFACLCNTGLFGPRAPRICRWIRRKRSVLRWKHSRSDRLARAATRHALQRQWDGTRHVWRLVCRLRRHESTIWIL
jgi:hypothetical protein